MSEVGSLRGNQAAALAAKLSRIQFMGAYPIPPSAEIMETISTFIQNGELNAAFLEAEGEKSGQIACFASAAAGCRTFNATSSQGLLYNHEALHLMSGSRMPMVLVVGCRSVFAPHSMHCEHTDAISQRDTGWIQIFCETVQEVMDTVIQAYKIAEHLQVRIPVMVMEDGYVTTHSLERVVIPEQEKVDEFLPPYNPSITDYIEPGGLPLFTSFGIMENWFTEFKYQERSARERAKNIIKQVDDEFAGLFNRKYGGLLEPYLTDDADIVLIMMGSMCSTARLVVNIMRSAGEKVGLLKIRSYRPFPYEEVAEVIGRSKAKAVIVLDRSNTNALRDEVGSAMYNLEKRPLLLGFIVGLNGRDVGVYNMIDLVEQGFTAIKKGFVEKSQQMYMVRLESDKGGDNVNAQKI